MTCGHWAAREGEVLAERERKRRNRILEASFDLSFVLSNT